MRLDAANEDPGRLRHLRNDYRYYGDQTCATDGLCALACPVNINTGDLIKHLRTQEHGVMANNVAWLVARHMDVTTSVMRFALNAVHSLRSVVGTKFMESSSKALRTVFFGRIPLWNKEMPKGANRPLNHLFRASGMPKVVYLPTCINRTFGAAPDSLQPSLVMFVQRVLRKAGYDVIVPEKLDNLCCGMAFASKGFTEQGMMKNRELEKALMDASENGRFPIVVDMSPCLFHMKETIGPTLKIYDQVDFALEFLFDKLSIRKIPGPIAVHATCSTRKMGMETKLVELANRLADSVVVPREVECCGWAGDRGFTVPELNQSALAELLHQIPENCKKGFSTSRTCEIGLSLHSGIPYQSIFCLIDACTEEKRSPP
jgi:D-lactate dehydrogenase